MYIDGAYFARPAAATLDFLDVDRVEVLRRPQGTLFGKNTTAGAINVTTRKPTFTNESEVELTYGSLGLGQAKASGLGPQSAGPRLLRAALGGARRIRPLRRSSWRS